jgi:tetratricopeptide (TPR) repeat protein
VFTFVTVSLADGVCNRIFFKTILTMKTFIPLRWVSVLAFALISGLTMAQPVTTPRAASPAATVQQTIGISTVSVNYSRPAVKGRQVWGALVPYGWNVQGFGSQKEAPWRAGANENTVITFSHPVKVEGVTVPAGSYGLFFVINKDNSGEVVLSKDHKSWGSFWYDPAKDQLRSKIQVRDIANTEWLTYDFINLAKNTGELVLNWEKKQFPVKLEFAVDEIVMANAEQELKGPVGFTPQGFTSAANYALQNNVNHEKALAWITQAIAANNTFATQRIKAGLLKQTGKTTEGDKIMKDAMATATEVELNNYGYQLMGQGETDKAIEVFILNTERNPKSANAWDSLGEAYATKGDKDNAIKNFKKSLSLNPPANVKANSEKFLKQYGAM